MTDYKNFNKELDTCYLDLLCANDDVDPLLLFLNSLILNRVWPMPFLLSMGYAYTLFVAKRTVCTCMPQQREQEVQDIQNRSTHVHYIKISI